MKEEEKQAIIDTAIELGFEEVFDTLYVFKLPLGNDSTLLLHTEVPFLEISKYNVWHQDDIETPIRKIESPEDLELLFNAICPEKYRLPFS